MRSSSAHRLWAPRAESHSVFWDKHLPPYGAVEISAILALRGSAWAALQDPLSQTKQNKKGTKRLPKIQVMTHSLNVLLPPHTVKPSQQERLIVKRIEFIELNIIFDL